MLKGKQFDLMRHGEPELSGVYLGRTDCLLSEQGRFMSAEALGENHGWDLVVSSPLQRCLDSAKWAAEKYGLELLVVDELQEFNFGDWDGRLFESVYKEQAEWADRFWMDPEITPPPNGETIEEFIGRVDLAKQTLLERKECRVLVITHGGVIRCLQASLLGIDAKYWGRIKVDYSHFTQLRFDYANEQYWPHLLSSNCRSPL